MISNNFIHPSQLGGLKQRSTINAKVVLTHIIQSEQVKNLSISILVFNIAQFFPSLNYQLLLFILDKISFNHKISMYLQNNFISPSFNINVNISYESVLSPIFSVLYLSFIFLLLENYLKILKFSISIISFVNDSLFIFQSKFIVYYNIILFLLSKYSLVVKYEKTDVFYFSRSYRVFNLLFLNLSSIGDLVLLSKKM